MKHLEFVDELQKFGISVRSTIREDEPIAFEIYGHFEDRVIHAKNFQLQWVDKNYNHDDPLKALLTKAVDMDEWKHSWHTEMIPDNYEKIKDIIQEKIIKRIKEANELLNIYFQLRYEISQINNTLVPNGYNISPKGGYGVKGCISEETKKKIGNKL